MATGQTSSPYMTSMEFFAAGSAVEAVGGAAAAVLAVLGLAALFPMTLSAVATIAVGAALLAEGAAIASRYTYLTSEAERSRLGAAELGGGMSAEFLGGAAGIVLGLLALLHVVPLTLMAVAAVVFGGALLLGSGATSRLEEATFSGTETTGIRAGVAHEAVAAASGAQVLAGLGSIVLGIIALVGIVPETLILVAMLTVGATILLSGSAVTARLAVLMHGR
jgi:hypothetical protein